MLVKDEADVVPFTIAHLLGQVDHIIVSDNASHDGTREMLYDLAAQHEGRITVHEDPEPGYFQDRKTTALAAEALERGFQWVIPCDADEYWYSTDGRRIADHLAGLAPDVVIVEADLYNHIPSALDAPDHCSDCGDRGFYPAGDADDPAQTPCERCGATGGEPNPFRRIGWRQREHGSLGKVAARLLPGLEIRMGNHSAWAPGGGMTVKSGLVVRHYSWRSTEQYVRKIRNGEAAYAATDMHESIGAHWRMFAGQTDEHVADHFRRWFWRFDPTVDDSLIYDPAPGA